MSMARTWRRVRSIERGKLLVMLGLLAVGLLLWGRLLMNDSPRQAEARDGEPLSFEIEPSELAQEPISSDLPEVQVVLPGELSRDLFSDNNTEEKADPTNSESTEKSESDSVDEESGAGLDQLDLQSVLRGSRPRAVINGRLVSEGEAIEGFTLKDVGDRHVVLEKGGRAYRLGL